jgi:hypothetical protein
MAKITIKQAGLKWQEILKAIKNSTPAIVGESIEEQVSRKKSLDAPGNQEEWFKYYFPKNCQRKDGTFIDPMPFHKAASIRVLENLEWYEVRMWSRELAKSTRTMMEVLYLVFVKGKRNIILTSCTEKKAIKLLRPYKANMEANQRLIQDYGEQESIGQWEKNEFITKSGASFLGIGLGQDPRGNLADGGVRPDILLFDDVDTDSDCRNPEMIKNNWAWIDEAVLGTRSISEPTTIIFCGNMIAKDCCVVRASKFAKNTEMIVNIRDKNGLSSWPHKNSEAMIDNVLSQRSYAAQQKEYYNNPLTEGSVFKKMNWKKARPLKDYEILVAYTDPSYKATADYKCTVLVGRWRGEYHIIKVFLEQTTTAVMISWYYKLMDMGLAAGVVIYLFMEEVFLQDIIKDEVTTFGKKVGRNIPLSGDTRKKPDKYQRIESLLEPLNRNGELYLNEVEKENPHMINMEDQFKAFAPGSRAHDDGPDAVEGAIWIINDKSLKGHDAIMLFERPINTKRY